MNPVISMFRFGIYGHMEALALIILGAFLIVNANRWLKKLEDDWQRVLYNAAWLAGVFLILFGCLQHLQIIISPESWYHLRLK